MSGNATNPSKRRMDCETVARQEVIQDYLVDRLSSEDRDAFEEHYFECSRCFDELRILRAVQMELRQARPDSKGGTGGTFVRWRGPLAALAATFVLAIGAALWLRPSSESAPPPMATPEAGPGQGPIGRPQTGAAEPQDAATPSLQQLARIEPPRYEPLRLRGAADEPTERFERGMERYRNGDYMAAVNDLRAAADLDPDAVHVRFFLGVSYLLIGQDTAAVESLRRTVALGDSPYLEEAHFYLAKALLRRSDVRSAEAELKEVVELRGAKADEARTLLMQTERLRSESK